MGQTDGMGMGDMASGWVWVYAQFSNTMWKVTFPHPAMRNKHPSMISGVRSAPSIERQTKVFAHNYTSLCSKYIELSQKYRGSN